MPGSEVTLSRAAVSDANISNMHNAEQSIHQGGFERELPAFPAVSARAVALRPADEKSGSAHGSPRICYEWGQASG